MKTIFMGTPEFAAQILESLLKNDMVNIVAVFTQPDKPQGRKRQLTASPVKILAGKYQLPCFQPDTLKDREVAAQIEQLDPALILVAAYGKILPPEILRIPKYGCINVHASLLPKYRGAAPIQRCIQNGEEKTGITIMEMNEGLDAGDIIMQKEVFIEENETSSALFEKLSQLGQQLLFETVSDLVNGTLVKTPQNNEESSYAPMIQKQEAFFSFTQTAKEIHNKIRAFEHWPVACFTYRGKNIKVLKSRLFALSGAPGTILDAKRCVVACQEGAIELLELRPEGKKAMKGADFINGNHLQKGDKL